MDDLVISPVVNRFAPGIVCHPNARAPICWAMRQKVLFCLGALASLAASCLNLNAQPERPLRQPGRTASPRPAGPWNRDLYILHSIDGTKFGERKLFAERAGVPCLTQDARGRLVAVFQWFPFERRESFDKIAVAFSEDGGRTWTEPRTVEFSQLPAEYERQFDPTIVHLADGRLRLYFTSNPEQEQTAIYSAISDDGLLFTFEPGLRFGVEGEGVVDCAVTKLADAWHLFAPIGGQRGRAYHAVSKDGLNFERKEDVSVPGRGTWIGNVVALAQGMKFYGSGPEGVWAATSADGSIWQKDNGARAEGGDPAVWQWKDGNFVMIVTGDLREDAPMNPPWRREPGPVARMEPMPGGPGAWPPTEFGVMPLPPLPGAYIAANAEYVYVFKDNVIYQFEARTLNLVRQVEVPEARGPGPRGPERDELRRLGPREPERREP